MPVVFATTKQDMKRLLARLQPRIREYLALESAFDLGLIAFSLQPTARRKRLLRTMHARLGTLRKQLETLSEESRR